jgi:hypothetical protein
MEGRGMSVNEWGVDTSKIKAGDWVIVDNKPSDVIAKVVGLNQKKWPISEDGWCFLLKHHGKEVFTIKHNIKHIYPCSYSDGEEKSPILAPLRNQVLSTTGCKVSDEAISLIIMWYEKQKEILNDND